MNTLESYVLTNGPKFPEARYWKGKKKDDTAVTIVILAPGYEKEDFEIEVTDEFLTVTGPKKTAPADLYAQGFTNKFARRKAGEDVAIMPIDEKSTTLTYEGGILMISISIPEEMHPKKLSVS